MGYGLFLPHNRGGWTEDLVFDGPGVQHILSAQQETWQREGNYSIEDLYNKGYVFVPSTPACYCKLFRVQHQKTNPSHALVHVEGEQCMLVPLRPMKRGEELTFDYFAGETYLGGFKRTQIQWDVMGEKLAKMGNKDRHPDDAIDLADFAFAQTC